MDLHDLTAELKSHGWLPRGNKPGLFRDVRADRFGTRTQFIDSLGDGRVEVWGGGLPWGAVMQIDAVVPYLKAKGAL